LLRGEFIEPVGKLNWSGGNTKGARSDAAEKFVNKVCEWHKENPDDPIRLVGHSHGGNVAIMLTNRLAEKGIKVETLITIATPVREYKLETEVEQHIQMYNNRDIVQTEMGGRWWLAGYTFTRKFKGADNVRTKDAETCTKIEAHSAMHSNVDIWKKYIEPILKLRLGYIQDKGGRICRYGYGFY
jgi:pimeloyl-ACP methyl ester carboxylesterase